MVTNPSKAAPRGPAQPAQPVQVGDLPIGTLEEFYWEVFRKALPGKGKRATGLRLMVERFRSPTKYYRIVWAARRRAWLAAEDQTRYATRRAGLLAAVVLSEKTGVVVDQGTR